MYTMLPCFLHQVVNSSQTNDLISKGVKLIFLTFFKFKKLISLRKAQSNLPVFKYKEQILETIKSNQVVIIAGDTGCGKYCSRVFD